MVTGIWFNADGSINHILTGVTATTDFGMWGNPVTGHIEASSGAGLIDINPLANGGAGSFRVINCRRWERRFGFARRKDRIQRAGRQHHRLRHRVGNSGV